VDPRAYLLHQVHPGKLATDITAEVVSDALLWRGRWASGLALRFAPAVIASAVLMRRDMSSLEGTARGRYVLANMPPSAQVLRAVGDVLTGWGSWRRSPPTVAAGLALIAAGWSFGLGRRTPSRVTAGS
jgi:hypothetical protein